MQIISEDQKLSVDGESKNVVVKAESILNSTSGHISTQNEDPTETCHLWQAGHKEESSQEVGMGVAFVWGAFAFVVKLVVLFGKVSLTATLVNLVKIHAYVPILEDLHPTIPAFPCDRAFMLHSSPLTTQHSDFCHVCVTAV